MKTSLILPTALPDRSRNASEVMTAMMRMMPSPQPPPPQPTGPRRSAGRSRARPIPYRHQPFTLVTRTDSSPSQDVPSPRSQIDSGTDNPKTVRGDFSSVGPPTPLRTIPSPRNLRLSPLAQNMPYYTASVLSIPHSLPLPMSSVWICSIQIYHDRISNRRRLI